MADTNTTTEAVQPTQLEIITGIDPNRQPVTLKGLEIIEQIDKFGDSPSEYKIGAMAGEEYYMFKFQGAIFTASPEFKKAFDAKTLYSVRFTPTLFPRTVPDPNNAAATKQIQGYGWSMDKATSLDDMMAGKETAKKIRAIEFELMKDEVIDKKKIEKFQGMDLSELITDDDMKILLKGA